MSIDTLTPQYDSLSTAKNGAFLHGNFALMSPASVFQILCQERRSVIMTAWHGMSKAHVRLIEGTIVSASCNDLEGAEAIYRLLTWTGGQFHLEPGPTTPTTTIITDCWEHLVLEAARRHDEQDYENILLSTGPSQQQLHALLEICPALTGVAIVGYDGRLLAEVEMADKLVPYATTIAQGLAVVGAALNGNRSVTLYINGNNRLLLAEWDDLTLVLAIPTPGARINDAINQLSNWTMRVI
ncbi:MAG: DUF4388 domain-containing protein [Chloroflexales bacterium]|nr:DUF4388 domain-containing protein [Chloroflexales bacterium]